MILEPDQYPAAPVYDLLAAAARGRTGLDRKWLDAILDRGEEAVPDLLRFGLEDRDGDRIDLDEDLMAIFRHLRTPRALPYYIKLLRNDPMDAADELLEAFLQFPAEALEPLLGLYDELEPKEREEVAFLLAALKVRDQRVFDRLLERLGDDPADAAFCLGVYGDPAARPHLEALIESLADDPDASFERESARKALEELGEDLPAPDLRREDIRDRYPESGTPQFELMDLEEHLEFLGCRTSEWRSAAAEQFCNRDLSPEAREALFRLALHDSDPAVRARAWEPLGSVLDDDPRIREAMKARLNDGDAPLQERCGTLVGLAREADDPVVRRWILEFYGDARSRARAMEAMRASMDRRFSAYFPQHLDDPDPEIRRQAIWGVGEFEIHSQAGRLRSFFDDEEFRADALFAYAQAVPAEVTPGRARALLKRIDREASGLTPAEANLVGIALDNRLAAQGYSLVFTRTAADGAGTGPQSGADPRPPQPPKAGRNEPCPCGSGRKYKKCCGA